MTHDGVEIRDIQFKCSHEDADYRKSQRDGLNILVLVLLNCVFDVGRPSLPCVKTVILNIGPLGKVEHQTPDRAPLLLPRILLPPMSIANYL